MRNGRSAAAGVMVLVLVFSLVQADSVVGPRSGGGGPAVSLDGVRDFFRDLFGVGGPSGDEPAPFAQVALPRQDALPDGEVWPEPERVRELTDLATGTATFYELSDGRVQAEISAAPVRYRDADGNLREIDTTVVASDRDGVAFENVTNTFSSVFGETTEELATFELDGRQVRLGVPGSAAEVDATAEGDTVTFAEVLGPGVDVAYEVTASALKERIVLARPPARASFTFALDTAGLQPRQLDDGSIGLFGSELAARPVLVMPPPFMFDSSEDSGSPYGAAWSDQVSQRLRVDGDRALVTVTADQQWLADPARVYPVTIDPTIKIQPTPTQAQDAMILSEDPDANFDGNWRLSVGTTDFGAARSMIRFDVSDVPAGTQLDSASLQMYYDQEFTFDGDVPLEARRVTRPWDAATVTWNSAAADIGEQGASVELVDDSDAGRTGMIGEWPSSSSPLTAHAIRKSYHYNNNLISGDVFYWQPVLPEDGQYLVQAHYVAASDRSPAALYTIRHADRSGSPDLTTVEVDQTAGDLGEWVDLGTYPFQAGDSHSVWLDDSPGEAVIADAVRFVKSGTVMRRKGEWSVWHSYDIRNIAQSWIDGTHPNYGVALKAVDESILGQGGPRYEAAEFAYNGGIRNTPKLILTWGEPGVELAPPERIFPTGAELHWQPYEGDDLAEYQVHRSVFQSFTPGAATLVAPVDAGVTTFTDTTATPTAVDDPDPFGQVYYYMVVAKTTDGELVPGPTQIARLPRAGRVVQVLQGDAADTTLTAGQSGANQDVLADQPWLMVGNNSTAYGTSRTVVEFPTVAEKIPAGAKVLEAELGLWSVTTVGSGATYDVHALTRGFDESTATWNEAEAGAAWTAAGGDYDPLVADIVTGNTNDPAWRWWYVDRIVQGWVDDPQSAHGLLVKVADESGAQERTLFLSSEAAEPMLRPKLTVVYTLPTAVQTYFAPDTPATRMIPGDDHVIAVTVSNPTGLTLNADEWELSYHWQLPDGTDVTNGGNQLFSPLPADIPPGGAVDVEATVRAPIQSDSGNKRRSYVLRWELHNKLTGEWLSASRGIEPLDQNVVVEDPTSDQLGLEKFYQYTGENLGGGQAALVNTHSGNATVGLNAWSNPGRGLSTFVRMTYNSMDTSASSMGFGWSLAGSTITRLGSPLEFHPPGQQWPTEVTLVDGDGTSHVFRLDKHGSSDPADWEYDSPAGAHLLLQQQPGGDPVRAWVMTKPDRTQFFFDEDGYPSAVVDRNGNTQTFTYEQRRSANKPIKFLEYVTDPSGRQTLTLEYYRKGDDYTFIDETGQRVPDTKLTNPHIIDQIRSITDVAGRRIEVFYTEKGLMAELVDGAGTEVAKTYRYSYDMTQGNKNVKLVEVTDPRGNSSHLSYYNPPPEPQFHWWAESITNRTGGTWTFLYEDPDDQAGSTMRTTYVDPEGHATVCVTDGFGRATKIVDALDRTTTLVWDADNNVVELTRPNGPVSTWTYDQKTGLPLSIRDPQANADGTPATTLTYRTGLNGYVADLISKTSPEGRTWQFGYDQVGNLTSVTDPKGVATPEEGDFTTVHTYDEFGRLGSSTDANGHTTTFADHHESGFPRRITDPLGGEIETEYDQRGNVLESTDELDKTTTVDYDIFGRPLRMVQPLDEEAGEVIVTPAPVYDPNDNIVVSTTPNGATTTTVYDEGDRPAQTTLPENHPDGPDRVVTMVYDQVGNLISQTGPNGNLTPEDPDDYVTTYTYDPVYQLTSIIDAEGNTTTHAYDEVGQLVATTDPLGNTVSSSYDLAGRVVTRTDAAGHTVTTEYDLDGLAVATIDQEGVRTETAYDERGMVVEQRRPHAEGVVRITRYEYDQVGNTTRVISPRGTATPEPDDFVRETVYDALNRPVERIFPYDPTDPEFDTPERITYEYDEAGRVTRVSAPPSGGQTVRNDAEYTYLDTGWVETSTDAWGISTRFDYNAMGQQTGRTLISAGGSSDRTLTWDYFLDGSLAARSDDGVPVGLHVVLVDNSDTQSVDTTGTWSFADTADDLFGFNYATSVAGTGDDTFTWHLHIPADGTYEVLTRWPQVTGAATDAPYTIAHDTGQDTVRADQTQRAGEWVSLGSFTFSEGADASITLADDADGTVVADAVKLVRDTSGETDTEEKDFTYAYDANGNQVRITDNSSGALVDTYQVTYDQLSRATQVREVADGVVVATTGYTYDPNGNVVARTHDRQDTTFGYDVRNLLSRVTVTEPGVDPKVTSYTYTPRGQRATQTKGNGNTVVYDYYRDGLLRTMTERRADGTLVASHDLDYDANSNRARDTVQVQDADDATAYLEHEYTYRYDPRDRITQVTKTLADGSATVESYAHDANGNLVSSTTDGTTTTSTYDRNRLVSTTTDGNTVSYTYDPFGRLDTVSAAGQVLQRYLYDGFGRTAEHRSLGADATTTRYTYDPFDRTRERTDDAGTAEAETTEFEYLGTSNAVIAELVDGTLDRSYQYSAGGERLSMHTYDSTGAPQEPSYYSYNAHGDVEAITDEFGDTRGTYGYTAYGKPDADLFTGVDDPQSPEPYNTYRFNARRVDPVTGDYDMGVRNYSPQLNRFLTRDAYVGGLSDLRMTTSPWTNNRYAFAGGNPISRVEVDGHCWICDTVGDLVGSAGDALSSGVDAVTGWWNETAQPWLGNAWETITDVGGDLLDAAGDLAEAAAEPVEDLLEAGAELAQDVASGVGEGLSDAWDWAVEHKAEILGTAAGIIAGGLCTVATAGAGVVGCAALGGAIGGGLSAALEGGSLADVALGALGGAAFGVVGGALGAVVGGALSSAVGGGLRGLASGALSSARGVLRGAASGLRQAISPRGLVAGLRGLSGNLRTAVGSAGSAISRQGFGGAVATFGGRTLRGAVSPKTIGAAVVDTVFPGSVSDLYDWRLRPENAIGTFVTAGL